MPSSVDTWAGYPFAKMSGSGNDFVLFDAIQHALPGEISHELVTQICNRRNGIGADGVVVLTGGAEVAATVSYYNADGSRGELCGNATLCSTAWCVSHGYASREHFALATDSGRVSARLLDDEPTIELGAVHEMMPTWTPLDADKEERRLGFVRVGVPHVVGLVDHVEPIDVAVRGALLRRDRALGAAGANANFVAKSGSGWKLRTFERGVEAETLACGTGAVATAILLVTWGLADSARPIALETRSGRVLTVTLAPSDAGGWIPSLSGEARLVFEGRIGTL